MINCKYCGDKPVFNYGNGFMCSFCVNHFYTTQTKDEISHRFFKKCSDKKCKCQKRKDFRDMKREKVTKEYYITSTKYE